MARAVAFKVARVGADTDITAAAGWDHVVIEWPQVYTAGKSKGDPNDLLPLVGVGCALCALASYAKLWRFLPAEWKGQLPKGEAYETRLRARLSAQELAVIEDAGSLTHNTLDAVGLGLFFLGRFAPRKVFPR